jgi:hypothetical protein
MIIYRTWYHSRGIGLHFEDFDSRLEALCYAKGLLMLGTGQPVDIRDAQTGALIDDLSLCAA